MQIEQSGPVTMAVSKTSGATGETASRTASATGRLWSQDDLRAWLVRSLSAGHHIKISEPKALNLPLHFLPSDWPHKANRAAALKFCPEVLIGQSIGINVVHLRIQSYPTLSFAQACADGHRNLSGVANDWFV